MEDSTFYHYLERKKNGEDYTVIRKELEDVGFRNEEISSLFKEIDEELFLERPSKGNSMPPRMIIGLITGIGSLTVLALGIHHIVVYVILFSSIASLAIRTPKRSNRERSKWSRH